MKINQFKSPTGVALGITDAPKSMADVQLSFREAKAALLDWKQTHGAACELVMFTYVCDESLHDEISSFLRMVYAEEQELAPLLRSVGTQVNLLNSQAKKVQEFKLGEANAQRGDKPWWKFW